MVGELPRGPRDGDQRAALAAEGRRPTAGPRLPGGEGPAGGIRDRPDPLHQGAGHLPRDRQERPDRAGGPLRRLPPGGPAPHAAMGAPPGPVGLLSRTADPPTPPFFFGGGGGGGFGFALGKKVLPKIPS